MASNCQRHHEAILSFDIGSTETRVALVWPDGATIEKRFIENRSDENTPLNGSAQFSSRVLVNDDNPIKYMGNASQEHREESSAKFIAYILAGKNEKLSKQYPILERLWREREKVGKEPFNARLEEAFNQFLCFVLERTKSALEVYNSNGKQIQIKKVAMTIPSQWDLTFEELYRRLFKRAFFQTFDDTPWAAAHDLVVVFHTEATALAQYIFHQSSHEAALGGGMPDIRTILSKLNAQCLIDCGGHNANSTLTQFHRNSDGEYVLYELRRPEGAGGGSEMWIHDLMKQLITQYHHGNEDEPEVTPEFYQALKRRLILSLELARQGATEYITFPHPQGRGKVDLEVTAEMRSTAFQMGFKHVKSMIESQLRELASIREAWGAVDHIVTVIVSGGSSLHHEFIPWIYALCKDLSLPQPLFTKSMEIHYAPARIALGAAYATLATQSVASFAEKCAFGLQKGNVVSQGENDEHLDLEGSANTIWYQERGVIPVTVDGGADQAEFRIVCQPFLESYREELTTDRNVARGASYDFLNIGTLPGGYKHRIEFALDDAEEQVELKIHRIPKPLPDKLKGYARQATKKEEKVLCLGPFPVHVQPGTRCLVIQRSTDEIDEQIASAMEDYRDDSDRDDSDRDETYRDDTDGDDSEGDDFDGDDDHDDDDGGDDKYRGDNDNDVRPGSARHSASSSLPPANNTQPVARSSAAAPSAAGNTSGASASSASSSTSKASSSGRGAFASKANTAHATSTAFRGSRAVSDMVVSNGQTVSRAPGRNLASTSGARRGPATGPSRNSTVASSGEASSSRYGASSSTAPASQGSASARSKRRASPEDDDRRPKKRAHTSDGSSSRAAGTSRQSSSRREVGRDRGAASSARQPPAASENRQNPVDRRDHVDHRPSADTTRFSSLAAPSRRPARAQDYSFSGRYRDRNSESSVRSGLAELRIDNNVYAGGSRSRGPATPPPAPRRHDHAPRWTPPAGGFGPSSPALGSPRSGWGSRLGRTSGPAGSSQQPQGFNGWDRANRHGYPPRRD